MKLKLIPITAENKSDILKSWNGAILSVHATKDGLSTLTKIEKYKALLSNPVIMADDNNFTVPVQSKTHYYEIMGGNHGQFGNYGIQAGDSIATISATAQQAQLIQVIQNFILKL